MPEVDQIDGTECSATVGNLPKFIRRIKVRQIRGNRLELALRIGVDDPVLTPVTAMAHELERVPRQRVKRMRDPDFAAGRSDTTCI